MTSKFSLCFHLLLCLVFTTFVVANNEQTPSATTRSELLNSENLKLDNSETDLQARYPSWDESTDVLISFYKQTTKNGNWKNSANWLEPNLSHCSWFGVVCQEGTTVVISLSLPNNGLSGSLPSSLSQLTSLQSLNLANNSLSGSIPTSFSQFTSLKTLDLSFNAFSSFEANFTFESWSSVQSISLSKNLFSSLPASFNLLNSTLEHLDISNNRFSEIPNTISGFSQLRIFNCSANPEIKIPDNFWSNTAIEELYLVSNRITEVSTKISQLADLTILDLSQNNLRVLPTSVSALENLQTLRLSDNALASIPSEIRSLQNLVEIDLNSNYIMSFPTLSSTKLKILRVQKNPFPQLNITEVFSTLEQLELSSAQLIPNNLVNSQLKVIVFFGPQIETLPNLPRTIQQLSVLETKVEVWPRNLLTQDLTSFISLKTLSPLDVFKKTSKSEKSEQVKDERDERLVQLEFPSWITRAKNLREFNLVGVQGSIPSNFFSGFENSIQTIQLIDSPLLVFKVSTSFPSSTLAKTLKTLVLKNLPQLTGTLPASFSALASSLSVFVIDQTGISQHLTDDSFFKFNSVSSCYFSPDNFTCEAESLLISRICNLKCEGDTIIGNWITTNTSHCQTLPNSNLAPLTYSKQTLLITEPNQFQYFVDVNTYCQTNLTSFSLSLSGTIQILTQVELSTPNQDPTDSSVNQDALLITATFAFTKKEVIFNYEVYAGLFAKSCDIPVETNTVYDITKLNCELEPTNIEFFSTDLCGSVNRTFLFYLSTGTIVFPDTVDLVYRDCADALNKTHNTKKTNIVDEQKGNSEKDVKTNQPVEEAQDNKIANKRSKNKMAMIDELNDDESGNKIAEKEIINQIMNDKEEDSEETEAEEQENEEMVEREIKEEKEIKKAVSEKRRERTEREREQREQARRIEKQDKEREKERKKREGAVRSLKERQTQPVYRGFDIFRRGFECSTVAIGNVQCSPICGDAAIVPPEQCDDGNTNGHDGCNVFCGIEPGWSCTNGRNTSCEPICGDGMVVNSKDCDFYSSATTTTTTGETTDDAQSTSAKNIIIGVILGIAFVSLIGAIIFWIVTHGKGRPVMVGTAASASGATNAEVSPKAVEMDVIDEADVVNPSDFEKLIVRKGRKDDQEDQDL